MITNIHLMTYCPLIMHGTACIFPLKTNNVCKKKNQNETLSTAIDNLWYHCFSMKNCFPTSSSVSSIASLSSDSPLSSCVIVINIITIIIVVIITITIWYLPKDHHSHVAGSRNLKPEFLSGQSVKMLSLYILMLNASISWRLAGFSASPYLLSERTKASNFWASRTFSRIIFCRGIGLMIYHSLATFVS